MGERLLQPAEALRWGPRTSTTASALVVLLHGVGSSAESMSPLAAAIADGLPHAAVVAPNGFERFDMGPSGFQWFSVAGVTEANRGARVSAALPMVEALIGRERERLHAPLERVAVVGFSQGGIMALHLAASAEHPPRTVASLAGRLAAGPITSPMSARPAVFMSQGAEDQVIGLAHGEASAATLRALGCPVEFETIRGHGHAVAPRQVASVVQHLATQLPPVGS